VSKIRSAPLKPLDRVREKGRGSQSRLDGHLSSNQTMSNFAQCFPQTNSLLLDESPSAIGLGKGWRQNTRNTNQWVLDERIAMYVTVEMLSSEKKSRIARVKGGKVIVVWT
jgi:hypothetical protein